MADKGVFTLRIIVSLLITSLSALILFRLGIPPLCVEDRWLSVVIGLLAAIAFVLSEKTGNVYVSGFLGVTGSHLGQALILIIPMQLNLLPHWLPLLYYITALILLGSVEFGLAFVIWYMINSGSPSG